MSYLEDEIIRLTRGRMIPNGERMHYRLKALHRMKGFYLMKEPLAPRKQSEMFKSFISAITYSETIIGMYHQLTLELVELAERIKENDTTTPKAN